VLRQIFDLAGAVAGAIAGSVCACRDDRRASRGVKRSPTVDGENVDDKPTGTSIVNATMYQNGQALEFLNDIPIATETATSTRKEGLCRNS
jgi:hypothetical protein